MKQFLIMGSVACVAFSTSALAEQTYSNNGIGTAQSSPMVHAIGEGHMVMQVQSQFSNLETDDSSNPLNGATGPCFGSVEIIAPAISGGGHCVYTDSQGDIAILTWTSEKLGPKGSNMGTWQLVGGNGKYVGASGGGTFDAATNPETGAQTNQVTGDITLQ